MDTLTVLVTTNALLFAAAGLLLWRVLTVETRVRAEYDKRERDILNRLMARSLAEYERISTAYQRQEVRRIKAEKGEQEEPAAEPEIIFGLNK